MHCNIVGGEDAAFFRINWGKPSQPVESLEKREKHRQVEADPQLGIARVFNCLFQDAKRFSAKSVVHKSLSLSYCTMSDRPVISAGFFRPIM